MIKYHFTNSLKPLDYPRMCLDAKIDRQVVNTDAGEDNPALSEPETLYISRYLSNWSQYTDISVKPMIMYNAVTCELISNGVFSVAEFGELKKANYVCITNEMTKDNEGNDVEVYTLRIAIADDGQTPDDIRKMFMDIDGVTDDSETYYFLFNVGAAGNISNKLEDYTYDKCCFVATIEKLHRTIVMSSQYMNSDEEFDCYCQYLVRNPEVKDDGEDNEDHGEEEGLPADDQHDVESGAE